MTDDARKKIIDRAAEMTRMSETREWALLMDPDGGQLPTAREVFKWAYGDLRSDYHTDPMGRHMGRNE